MSAHILTIPLMFEYFDQIKSGEKVEEFRQVNEYWSRRLVGRTYDFVVLTRAYPKGGGIEGKTRLTRNWLGYRETMITHPVFKNVPTMVFAIDVSEPG